MSDCMTEDAHDLAVDLFHETGNATPHKQDYPNCKCLEAAE